MSNCIRIRVVTPNDVLIFEIEPDVPVGELIRETTDKIDYPDVDVAFTCCGKVLDENRSFREQNIHNGQTVHCMLRNSLSAPDQEFDNGFASVPSGNMNDLQRYICDQLANNPEIIQQFQQCLKGNGGFMSQMDMQPFAGMNQSMPFMDGGNACVNDMMNPNAVKDFVNELCKNPNMFREFMAMPEIQDMMQCMDTNMGKVMEDFTQLPIVAANPKLKSTALQMKQMLDQREIRELLPFQPDSEESSIEATDEPSRGRPAMRSNSRVRFTSSRDDNHSWSFEHETEFSDDMASSSNPAPIRQQQRSTYQNPYRMSSGQPSRRVPPNCILPSNCQMKGSYNPDTRKLRPPKYEDRTNWGLSCPKSAMRRSQSSDRSSPRPILRSHSIGNTNSGRSRSQSVDRKQKCPYSYQTNHGGRSSRSPSVERRSSARPPSSKSSRHHGNRKSSKDKHLRVHVSQGPTNRNTPRDSDQHVSRCRTVIHHRRHDRPDMNRSPPPSSRHQDEPLRSIVRQPRDNNKHGRHVRLSTQVSQSGSDDSRSDGSRHSFTLSKSSSKSKNRKRRSSSVSKKKKGRKESKFEPQLQRLVRLGYTDRKANLEALTETDGYVKDAMRILSKPPSR